MGRYTAENHQPIKATLKLQVTNEETITKTYILKGEDDYKNVLISINRNEEERSNLRQSKKRTDY